MSWRQIHRWLGLSIGLIAIVLGLSGVLLSVQPLQESMQAPAAGNSVSVSELAGRLASKIEGIEEIRRLPSGSIVVFAFSGDTATASFVDPENGNILGYYQPSDWSRWIKNLHRAFLLGDAGRMVAASIAFFMLLISISGIVVVTRRMGGWKKLAEVSRGTLIQRIHVDTGRIVVIFLCLSSLTALYMSAATFGLIKVNSDWEPNVVSVIPQDVTANRKISVGEIETLKTIKAGSLHQLNFPDINDPEDTWKIVSDEGEAYLDQYNGMVLAQHFTLASQVIYDGVILIHTGRGAWFWALLLGVMGASIPVFWFTGLILWWQARKSRPKLAGNSSLIASDIHIFVASESGSTWGFAIALHRSFVEKGYKVHSTGIENFAIGEKAKQVFILAATYGNGQAPAHAVSALPKINAVRNMAVPVTVLGFGDRLFTQFCGYADELDDVLRNKGFPSLLSLEKIHQQSAQQFFQWCNKVSHALNETLVINYEPRIPDTRELRLVSRQEFSGVGEPAVILRFEWPKKSRWQRVKGQGFPVFKAGDLVGILPPNSTVPRYYSLASAYRNGFLEICVRRMLNGYCSTWLFSLKKGDSVNAFIKPNDGFTIRRNKNPVILIGAGTGVAPLAGFIRDNDKKKEIYLYFGTRDPSADYYFGEELNVWLSNGQLTELHTVFSRIEDGGGYVQDALQRDAEKIRNLILMGADIRVCGGMEMAVSVENALNGIFKPIGLSVQDLKEIRRYAEDVF